MTLTLTLPSELERRLRQEAAQHGLSAPDYVQRLLEQHLRQENSRAEAIAQIQSWIEEEDDAEQIETGTYLIRALDEDRPSNRKLFPLDLKGQSW